MYVFSRLGISLALYDCIDVCWIPYMYVHVYLVLPSFGWYSAYSYHMVYRHMYNIHVPAVRVGLVMRGESSDLMPLTLLFREGWEEEDPVILPPNSCCSL